MFWDALYTDPTFGVDFIRAIEKNEPPRVTYDAMSFVAQVESAKPGQSVALDEAGEAWNNREWATETNRILLKVSQQIRERNLDVHIVAPKRRYIDPGGQSRCSDWAYYYLVAGERGYVEFLRQSESKWDKKQGPYWETFLHHRFLDLPPKYAIPYKRLKREAGAIRMERYLDTLKRDLLGKPSMKDAVDEAFRRLVDRKDRDRFRGQRGQFDPVLIQTEFGITARASKAVAIRATRKLGVKKRSA